MAPRIMGATAPPPVLVFGEQYSGLPYDCANATAVAYVETTDPEGVRRWGIGTDTNIVTASLKAVLSAARRARE